MNKIDRVINNQERRKRAPEKKGYLARDPRTLLSSIRKPSNGSWGLHAKKLKSIVMLLDDIFVNLEF